MGPLDLEEHQVENFTSVGKTTVLPRYQIIAARIQRFQEKDDKKGGLWPCESV